MNNKFIYKEVTIGDCIDDRFLLINMLNQYGDLGYEAIDINREDPHFVKVIFKRLIIEDETDKLLNQLWKTLSK